MTRKNGHGEHHEAKAHEGTSLKSAAEIAAAAPAHPELVVEILQKELDELRAQAAKAQENWDRLLRAQADMDNYRKRMVRERQELVKAANENLLLELLTPLGHFEMGLQSAQQQSADDPLRQGMEMILAQFQQFLKSHGVSEIQSLGQPFDPALHEAVAHQESDAPEGEVIQQLRKGYRLNDKLLRAATVIVSKGKPDAQS